MLLHFYDVRTKISNFSMTDFFSYSNNMTEIGTRIQYELEKIITVVFVRILSRFVVITNSYPMIRDHDPLKMMK